MQPPCDHEVQHQPQLVLEPHRDPFPEPANLPHLFSDRGIYRPGETVRLTSLVRDREAKAVADRKGYVVVKRPSGLEFKRYPFDATPGGALAIRALFERPPAAYRVEPPISFA